MSLSINKKNRKTILIPQDVIDTRYTGTLYGLYHDKSGVFNVFSDEMKALSDDIKKIGEIHSSPSDEAYTSGYINAFWKDNELAFVDDEIEYEIKPYTLKQNVFSRNSGILETDIMENKVAIIMGCGSVGSLVALELARAGVGNFLLIDNDVVEYHNICRHQCSVLDVGEYKTDALAKRILQINPTANISSQAKIVEQIGKNVFDEFCHVDDSIIIGCADNRAADVYANSIAVSYGIPFLSIGFWERAFAGELFYYLPNKNMPCYKCALGDGGEFSQRTSTNRRFYTNEENLASVNFEPGISVDIGFVTIIGVKLALDILNIKTKGFTPRLIHTLQQYTLVCNTNDPRIGGDMAEIFSYPLQVTTSLQVGFCQECPPCKYL